MTIDLRTLLEAPAWRSFDVDDAGRLLAGSDSSGSTQLTELAPDGTATPLTALPGPCTGRYLPGRRAVVVEHDTGGDELAQLSLLEVADAASGPLTLGRLTPLVHDPRYQHRLLDVTADRIFYVTNRRNNVDFDVVARSVADGTETVLYDGGGYTMEAKVSPDGARIAVLVPGTPANSLQLLVIDTATGTTRPVTGAGEPARTLYPAWLPDGSLVVGSDRDREFVAAARIVLGADAESDVWTWLVEVPERDLSVWPSPDGRLLLVLVNDDGVTAAAVHEAAGGRLVHATPLPVPGWAGDYPSPPPTWSPDSRYVALSYSAPQIPGDVLLIDAQSGEVRTVVSSAAPLAGHRLSVPESHRVPAPDGEQIPCFVYRPTNDTPTAAEGSAVLVVHGGPEGQSTVLFNPVIQAFAAAGHTVLVPNVRGSVGYGKRWYAADDVYKRLDSVADLAALHAWLPTLGLDPKRAGLYGGSYGGYMVLAGLAFQPELWAAGVAVVAISSFVTFLENTSPYRRSHREREYGSLEHDREFLESVSPLNRADAIRAPLMLIHGANDPRVPLSEAEQLADQLAENGVPADLLVYGDEGHGLARRANKLDAYPQVMRFFGRWLAGE